MRSAFLSFGAGALGALLVIVLHGAMITSPEFASVDVQQLLAAHIEAIRGQPLDPETRQRDAAAFAHALESALDQVAQDHVIVLVGPAVLRGVPDATAQVRSLIDRQLRSQPDPGKAGSP